MPTLQRSNLTTPTIASVGTPSTGPDNSSAQAVTAIGGAVRDFAVKERQGDLLEDLEILGDEVEAAKTGKDVKRVTDRFKSLKRAREQGELSDNMVRIKTEAVLKESIEAMPAFAPELRRYAAEHLGYDPTGEQLRQKLDIPTPAQEDPLVKQARSIVNATGANFDDVLNILGQAQLRQAEVDLVTAQAALGAAGAREVFNATLKTSQDRKADLMADIMAAVKSGGVENERQVQSMITAMVGSHKSDFLNSLNAANIHLDPQDISSYLSTIDADWAGIQEMAQEGSLEAILEQNEKSLTSAMTVAAWDVMGDIALINKAGGQEAVKNYFTYAEKYKTPEQLNLLRQVNPELGRVMDQVGDMRLAASAGYKRVMGIDPKFSALKIQQGAPNLTEEELNILGDQALQDLTKQNNLSEPEKDRRAQYAILALAGRKWKVVGAYMQQGARENATDAEVDRIVDTYNTEYEPLLANIANGLVDRPNTEIIERNGKLAFSHVGHPATGEMWADLSRLSAFIKGANNGWANDFGVDPGTFKNETTARINSMVRQARQEELTVEEAIDQFDKDPSVENLNKIKALAPDIVDAALSRVPGVSGGANGNQ